MSDDTCAGQQVLARGGGGLGQEGPHDFLLLLRWFLAEPGAPNPMLSKWGFDVPFALEQGKCKFWQPETMPNFETTMHRSLHGNRLAWNPKLKPEDVYKESTRSSMAHAAKEMTAYWRFIDSVWTGVNEYSGFAGLATYAGWTPESMK